MKKSVLILLTIFCFACAEKQPEGLTVLVKNTLDIDRNIETIEINKTQLASLETKFYKVIDIETDREVISQVVDIEADGVIDFLLFQTEMLANSEKSFKVIGFDSDERMSIDSTQLRCYSRFVPERTDDYAWENDKVAFRTYGPKAQKMKEDGVKGGTLSSGMDAWLKRVDYPIINKWYKKHTSGTGSYHEDTGEGLDNFHVGVSRGVGGTAVKTDSGYAVSKNFVSYKTITNGPIRTSFILDYESYDANDKLVNETKYISLDYGQNLSHHEIKIKGVGALSVGLTLHKKDGQTTTNLEEGWISYWEPYYESELGLGIVVPNEYSLIGFDKYITDEKDKSNLYAHIRPLSNKVNFYAGFGWKKSGQFNSKIEWESYLSIFSRCLDTPLIVELTKSTN